MTCVQIPGTGARVRSTAAYGAVVAALAVTATCGGGSSVTTPPDPDPPQSPPGPCVAVASCSARLALGAGAFLPYYATHRLDVGAADQPTPATRAVVVVHGNSRNADDYFERVVAAAEGAGHLQSTVVVAPRFQTSDDGPGTGEPYWTSPGWKRGHPSEGGASPAVSSYAALDTVVARLADRTRFPRLTHLVVTGHSAGGQVAHRYAAGSPMEERLAGIAARYVVANPSTYLYPTPLREWAGQYVTPESANCPDYDSWHYGLQDLPPYMLLEGADSARVRLLRRDAIVLAGDQDTGTSLLDQSCGANFQGANRFQRAQALLRTLDHVFPGEHRHRLVVVPGVGHSSAEMYQSAPGRRSLFEP